MLLSYKHQLILQILEDCTQQSVATIKNLLPTHAEYRRLFLNDPVSLETIHNLVRTVPLTIAQEQEVRQQLEQIEPKLKILQRKLKNPFYRLFTSKVQLTHLREQQTEYQHQISQSRAQLSLENFSQWPAQLIIDLAELFEILLGIENPTGVSNAFFSVNAQTHSEGLQTYHLINNFFGR